MSIQGIPNAYIVSDELYYNDRQKEAFRILFDIAKHGIVDVVYYNIRNNPDALTVDDFTNVPKFNLYLEYTDVTFDEIDEQISTIYKDYKSFTTENNIEDVSVRPFIMIVDGVSGIKDPDEFRSYMESELSLMEFLNIYMIAII